nr:WSC domain-containing protein 1-like [Penaeus vannamei]
MKLRNGFLRYFPALVLFGILLIIGCAFRDAGPVRLVSKAAPSPPRYGGIQDTLRDVFMDMLYDEEEENEWEAMPDERNGQLPEARWPLLDPSMPNVPLWPSDPACSMYNVSFALNITKTFLVSYPRSGNSWTRYLIEGASGVATAAIYPKEKLYHFEMLSDLQQLRGKVILTKTHLSGRRDVPDEVPAILLLRNPAKSIVSFYNYMRAPRYARWRHNVSYQAYFNTGFANFANHQLFKWTKLAKDRLSYSRRLLVVPYEELREDPIAQVRRALAFLGIPADEGRLACLQNHIQGPALGLQRQVDPYSPEQKVALAEAVASISELLRKRNFPPLPDYNE